MLSKNAVAWLVLLSGGVFGLFLAGHRIPHRQAPRRTWQAPYAIAAQVPFVGGPSRVSAIVFRFWTIAARWKLSPVPDWSCTRISAQPALMLMGVTHLSS